MSQPPSTPPPLPSGVVATPLSNSKKSGCLLQVLLMNPIWTGIGGLAALVAIFVPFLINDRSGAGSSIQDHLAEKHSLYPHTVDYWNQWAAARKQHDDAVMPLREREFPEHALKCAEWEFWLADTTAALPQVGVDPDLTQLAVEFVTFYRARGSAWHYQAVLMQTAKLLEDSGEMSPEDVDAFMKMALSNPIDSPETELDVDGRLKKAWGDLHQSMLAANAQYSNLRVKRDQLRARLIAEHKQELPW